MASKWGDPDILRQIETEAKDIPAKEPVAGSDSDAAAWISMTADFIDTVDNRLLACSCDSCTKNAFVALATVTINILAAIEGSEQSKFFRVFEDHLGTMMLKHPGIDKGLLGKMIDRSAVVDKAEKPDAP